jgi:hypothetical protein
VNFKKGVRRVVLATEQGRQLDLFRLRAEILDRFKKLGPDVLSLLGQFEKGGGVVDQRAELAIPVKAALESGASLLELLGPVGLPPDLGTAQLGLELRQGGALPFRIKGTSEALAPFRRAPRSGPSAPEGPPSSPSNLPCPNNLGLISSGARRSARTGAR